MVVVVVGVKSQFGDDLGEELVCPYHFYSAVSMDVGYQCIIPQTFIP